MVKGFSMNNASSSGIGIIGSAVVTVLATYGLATAAASGFHQPTVADNMGALHVPPNYRLTYQYLGSWAVAAEATRGSKEMHAVYASPGAIAAFRKAGTFADGTVLVKEVFATDTQPMTTGTVSHAQTLKGWFVMVKDSKGSHPGNALWGNGWGWSWFDAGEPNKTTSTDFKKDCLSCHLPAKATDWIYTQGYPALQPQ
jgi:hypothetical protein